MRWRPIPGRPGILAPRAHRRRTRMGPLEGIRLVEIAGIGPGPYCAMVLADMGAEVVRVVRPGPSQFGGGSAPHDLLSRGRRSICVDLKRAEGIDTVLRLADRADGLFEGFRPGGMERLAPGAAG